jgi:hypothetical protein
MLRTTVSRPVCLGIKHPFGAYDQIFITCVTITVFFLWGALSDERSSLSFVYAAGSCQRSPSRVRVPWDSRPYFTVSHLRLPFSSPPIVLMSGRRVMSWVFCHRVWSLFHFLNENTSGSSNLHWFENSPFKRYVTEKVSLEDVSKVLICYINLALWAVTV